eukprot:gene892-899_t
MAEDLNIITSTDKQDQYRSLIPQIEGLLSGEPNLVANLANVCAALKEQFKWFWVGFYLGVCGAAWAQAQTLVVPDVEEFPGHIACSSLSRSEIVIPVLLDGHVVAVLDVDSELLNHFDDTDARDLLGKYLFTRIDGITTGGYIVETEAYNGIIDRASHAFGNRRTQRTATMFMNGGLAYVYLCYGIHEMFNVVTSTEGEPHAILIRAINPTDGLELMMLRRNMQSLKTTITSGPGSVAKALGISRTINGISLQDDRIWIEDRGLSFNTNEIAAAPRIGVAYAAEDALLPYRFYIKGNIYVSKPNK